MNEKARRKWKMMKWEYIGIEIEAKGTEEKKWKS